MRFKMSTSWPQPGQAALFSYPSHSCQAHSLPAVVARCGPGVQPCSLSCCPFCNCKISLFIYSSYHFFFIVFVFCAQMAAISFQVVYINICKYCLYSTFPVIIIKKKKISVCPSVEGEVCCCKDALYLCSQKCLVFSVYLTFFSMLLRANVALPTSTYTFLTTTTIQRYAYMVVERKKSIHYHLSLGILFDFSRLAPYWSHFSLQFQSFNVHTYTYTH